jgi:hypothetical protein
MLSCCGMRDNLERRSPTQSDIEIDPRAFSIELIRTGGKSETTTGYRVVPGSWPGFGYGAGRLGRHSQRASLDLARLP